MHSFLFPIKAGILNELSKSTSCSTKLSGNTALEMIILAPCLLIERIEMIALLIAEESGANVGCIR